MVINLEFEEQHSNIKVLLINDEFFILNMMTLMLKKERMIYIDTAYNGYEGFKKAISNSYDLIICDINMPVMDGYRFCANFLKNFSDNN